MARIPLMAGNWKTNLDHLEANHPVQGLAMEFKDHNHDHVQREAFVTPPSTGIRTAQMIVDADELSTRYSAQNASIHDNGVYTGEIPTVMLDKLGCTYVVMGHSERHEHHNEFDKPIGQKARKVLDADITPILYCGRTLEVRKADTHAESVLGQIRAVLAGWFAENVTKIVITYEPIRAIGTGETATSEDVQEVCGATRKAPVEDFRTETAEAARVLYGGSTKSGSIKESMVQPDIDSVLIGNTSLKAEPFTEMARLYA